MMKAFFLYLYLEFKRAGKVLPCFFAVTMIMTLLMGGVANIAGKMLSETAVTGRITVGVVIPPDDKLAEKVISILESMDSVREACDFIYLEEEEGKKRLDQGELLALMIVPPKLVKGIITGMNVPVKVILPEHAGLESLVFQELVNSGAATLSAAQAAIYAAGQLCMEYGEEEKIPAVEETLNKIFLDYILPREEYFRLMKAKTIGDITMAQHYGLSAAVLFLLLCGIPAAVVLKPKNRAFQMKLQMLGMVRWRLVMIQIMVVTLLLGAAALLPLCLLWMWKTIEFTWYQIPLLFFICLVISSFIVAVYEVSGNLVAGVLCLFLASVGMLFVSGGIIPSVFLPEGIRGLSFLMPTTMLIRGMKLFLIPQMYGEVLVPMCSMGAGFYGIAVLAGRRYG